MDVTSRGIRLRQRYKGQAALWTRQEAKVSIESQSKTTDGRKRITAHLLLPTNCARSIVAFLFLGAPVIAASAQPTSKTLGLPYISDLASPLGEERAMLGKKIFFDARLSADGSVRCASCHVPEKAFTDGKAKSEGVHNKIGTRNAPSLIGARFNTSQFWDGRRPTLEAQARDPLVNPREHGLEGDTQILRVIQSDRQYIAAFSRAFPGNPGRVTVQMVEQALGSFEKTLVAGDSPFDRFYYGGDTAALSKSAINGLRLFQTTARCASCHTIDSSFALFSDNAFHSSNIGMQKISPNLDTLTIKLVKARERGNSLDDAILGDADLAELGRFAVTLKPADIGKFRTPSLRNVALTAPYMHDGSIQTLSSAVERELYNREAGGRPLILTPRDKQDLVEFLRSLTSPHIGDFAATN